MQIILRLLIVLIVLLQPAYAANHLNPTGFWRTIDDKTGQPKSIIHITESANHELHGKVVKLFPSAKRLCEACTGATHNQPILGMSILSGLKPDKNNTNEWVDGIVFDPKPAKTYHCNLTINDSGQELTLRGYVGIPLFGRSQRWQRVSDPAEQ